jgi:hypothetical protein
MMMYVWSIPLWENAFAASTVSMGTAKLKLKRSEDSRIEIYNDTKSNFNTPSLLRNLKNYVKLKLPYVPCEEMKIAPTLPYVPNSSETTVT